MTTTSVPTETPAALGLEEIVDRLIPSDPQISPDGRHVAFTVSTANKTKDGKDRAIWLSRDRGPAARFTGGTANNSSPTWSPDGTKLLFIANRRGDDKEQLYVLPLDGGEAQRLGELDGDLGEATWSPDGSLIAVLRSDPETEAEKKKREDLDDPIVYEEDPKPQRLWIIDAETGKARQLTYGEGSVWGYTWSPDGKTIVFTTSHVRVINEMFRKTSLWRIPVTGGLRTHLLDAPDGIGSMTVREADGVPVVAYLWGERVVDPAVTLWTVPLAGGTPTKIVRDHEGTFTELIADPADRGQVIARVVHGTTQALYRIPVTGGELTPITPPNLLEKGSVGYGATFSADGSAAAIIWSASDVPQEIYVADLGSEATPVTEFGKTFAGRLQPGEIVRWASTDGVEIEGVLIRPRGYVEGTRVPLIVEIHGGPSWQWEDRILLDWHDWAQMLASQGYAVLLPNPRGSTGRGSAFEKLLFGDVGGGESRDLISGALAMVERGIADPERLGLGGWSWGGYLTAQTITQTTIFKAAVMGAGVANLISDHAAGDIAEANMSYYPGHPYTHWDLYAKGSPIRNAAQVVTPTLIVHGGADVRVHPTQGQEFYRALKEVGVPVRFVMYPREGHSFQERAHQLDLLTRISAWYAKYLPVD